MRTYNPTIRHTVLCIELTGSTEKQAYALFSLLGAVQAQRILSFIAPTGNGTVWHVAVVDGVNAIEAVKAIRDTKAPAAVKVHVDRIVYHGYLDEYFGGEVRADVAVRESADTYRRLFPSEEDL